MKWVAWIACGVLLSGVTQAGVDLLPYKERIATMLPAGWASVSVGDSLIVRRMEPIQGVPRNKPNAEPVKTAYRIKLKFKERIGPDEYARTYIADKGARDAGKSTLKLPAYYDDSWSLDIDEGAYLVKGDSDIECAMVLGKIRSLFKPYVGEQKVQSLEEHKTVQKAVPRTYHPPIQTVLRNYEFKNLKYSRLSVGKVMQALDKRFYEATNQKISPTIRYSGLSQKTLNSSVTLAVSRINARDLLDMLCSMYDMSYTIKHGQIVISDNKPRVTSKK